VRLGIDIRYLSHGLVGGIHTYLLHLVPALLEQAADDHVFLYADTKRPVELGPLPVNATLRRVPWRSPLSSIYQDFTLRRVMARDQLDLVHFPANYGFGPRGASTAITLHDSINILPFPEIVRGHPRSPRTLAMMTYLHLCSRTAIQRAELVLTVSTYAAHDIARRSGLPQDRIVAIHHGPSSDLRRITDPLILTEVRHRLGLTTPFVLADALKNPVVLVNAWRRLPADLRGPRRLAFFSRRPDPPPVVAEAVATGEALLLGRVSRADLIALYSMADAFAFPSWIEGFGIPVLEAMACGAPVVASDRGAIPEVAGNAALLVDADDAAGLAAHLTAVLSDSSVAAALRQRGLARAAQFSWRSAAEQTLRAYTRAVSSRRDEAVA
jgi:glycosyltransferase involved in cell wall biosynthesis